MRTSLIALWMALLIVSMPICMASETSFQTDANGNLVYDGQFYREYNGLNQLVRIYNGSSTSSPLLQSFEHDPVEERVIKKVTYNPDGSPNETVIYFDKDYVRVDYHNGTVLDTEFVFLNGQMVAQVTNDKTLFVHADHLGSTSTMTDENGDIVENTLYSPYGEVLSGGRELRYGYEGKEHSGLNLPTEGLVSYYSFENAAKDDTSNHDGNITGATETIGKVNKAYHFNGSHYITIGQNADFGDLCLNGCTISGWVKISSTGNYALVGRWDSARYTFLLRNYGNDVDFYLGNGSSYCRSINTGDNIPLNTWQHFVGVYNKTHTMTFLNGIRKDLDACTMTVPVVGPEKTYIGMYDDSSFSNKMLGDIDEVAIWNRSLTDAEIKQVYEHSAQHDTAFRETDFNFRMYNSEIGMFTKPDSLIPNVYDPQSLNRYSFERGNPFNRVDPDGHIAPLLYYALIGAVGVWQFGDTVGYGIITLGYTAMILREPERWKEHSNKALNSLFNAGMCVIPQEIMPLPKGWSTIGEDWDSLKYDWSQTSKRKNQQILEQALNTMLVENGFQSQNHANIAMVSVENKISQTSYSERKKSTQEVYVTKGNGKKYVWKYDTINNIPVVNGKVEVGTDIGGGWIYKGKNK